MRGRTTTWFSHWLSQLLSGSLLRTTIMSFFCSVAAWDHPCDIMVWLYPMSLKGCH